MMTTEHGFGLKSGFTKKIVYTKHSSIELKIQQNTKQNTGQSIGYNLRHIIRHNIILNV